MVESKPRTLFDTLKDVACAVTDFGAIPTSLFALARAPKSDGHSVLVFPGFLTTDQTTWGLRYYLERCGFRTHPWGLGINLGMSTAYEYDIEALVEHRLKEVYLESGDRKVSVLGWSLGGVYAREVARKYPHLIRDVITLGSPINGYHRDVSLWRIYELVTKMRFHDPEFAARMDRIKEPVGGVPVTAIYSPNDGIVPSSNAMSPDGPLVQNIEVDATHCGMVYNPFVMYLIAHRLAQSEAAWAPLDVEALHARFRAERSPLYA